MRVQIVVVAIGRLKERHWKEAQAEYVKRLRPFASFSVEEVDDEPETGQPLREQDREAERALTRIRPRDYIIALDLRGEQLSSEAFSAAMEKAESGGYGRFVFVVGGSTGLSERVSTRANLRLSLSELTFPHQLARVVLLEQIYRSFQIKSGSPYHK